ncbi:hypothetical protein [Glycomyces sp. NRRL B-16210]|uniref:hypothetical protein n=1 Tax=Glycomyces sp. NRRL B-16210 TaxID=1463821 RepID=UPI000B12987B|nr:hypothetical protein [Glycomyces sp. NRRL B-16210]
MAPPPQPPQQPSQPGPPTGFIPQPPPRPSDAPSPIGLIVAGIGLALLCVSALLPRFNVDDLDGGFSFYMYSGVFGNVSTLDASTAVLSLALVTAVALSAHRNPGVRWPARLGAIGAAALTATFAYYPVVAMRQYAENFTNYDEFGQEGCVPRQPGLTVMVGSAPGQPAGACCCGGWGTRCRGWPTRGGAPPARGAPPPRSLGTWPSLVCSCREAEPLARVHTERLSQLRALILRG